MPNKYTEAVFNFQCFVILNSFLLNLKVFFKKDRELYIKYFLLFNLVALGIMIPYFLMVNFFAKIVFPFYLNNFSVIFGFSFLSLFIINQTIDFSRKILLFLLYFIFLSCIVYFLFFLQKNLVNFYAFTINYFGLICFCLIYYYMIYNTEKVLDVTKMASFWIVTGVFFCSSLCFPTYVFSSIYVTYYQSIFMTKYVMLVNFIPSISYTIMHLFFIKAYSCKIYKTG
jgi:hypothetical protein